MVGATLAVALVPVVKAILALVFYALIVSSSLIARGATA